MSITISDDPTFHNVDAWGQDERQLAAIQRKFLAHFRSGGTVLDLGAGRGVFLDLLREAGFTGRGVDLDEEMTRRSRAKGHDVVTSDALSYLRQDERSYDGILASHIIEHMPVSQQVEFIELIKARLAPGGVGIVVTPRPGSLWAAEAFWLDTTHVRPVAYGLMEALFAPFEILAGGIEPDSDPTREMGPLRRALVAMRKRIIGPELADFVYGGGVNYIVARRPSR